MHLSGATSCNPQPVAVRVFQVTLATSETIFINRDAELFRYRIDVVDVEVDQTLGRCVAGVLREVKPNAPARYRHEPREAWLKLMLPLLPEPEALVPLNRATSILHTENRHDLLSHGAEPRRTAHRGRKHPWPAVAKIGGSGAWSLAGRPTSLSVVARSGLQPNVTEKPQNKGFCHGPARIRTWARRIMRARSDPGFPLF